VRILVFNIGISLRIKRLVKSLLVYAKKHPFILLGYFLVFILGGSLRIFVERNFGTLQWDEGAHSIGGVFLSRLFLNILQGRFDLASFAWSYLADYRATIGGLWFYPFGYSLFTAIAYLFFGYNEFAARLPSLVLSILLVHATICLAKEIDPREIVALISAFLVAISSAIVIVGSAVMVDIPLTTLTMYSILYWIRGMENHRGSAFLKAGLLGGLAGLMKPSGVLILPLMVVFQTFMFVKLKDKLIFSKEFWKGIVSGSLLFSTWWVSALLLNAAGGPIGEAASECLRSWFYFFEGHVPPWYSPQWYMYEGWTYYASFSITLMGLLPFTFLFVGIGYKLKGLNRKDFLLIFFSLAIYVILSFGSNKNPRYIIPLFPIFFIYSSVGLNSAFLTFMERLFPMTKSALKRVAQILVATSLILIVLLGCLMPTLIAIRTRYIPGMGYGPSLPIQEALTIVVNDKDEGIIIPDSEDNYFNINTLTFYVTSIDYDRKYACHCSPSNPQDILSFRIGEKRIKYVLVHDSNSVVGEFVQVNQEYFFLLGVVENAYGIISVYKVIQ